MDDFNTRNTAIITAGVTLSLAASIALGVVGNTLADRSHERVAVACVQAGGSWLQVPNTGSYECRR